jgi:hypothetical protein
VQAFLGDDPEEPFAPEPLELPAPGAVELDPAEGVLIDFAEARRQRARRRLG